MVIMCLFLIIPNILEGTAKASTTVKSTSDQTYINKAQDLPAPSPAPSDFLDFSTDSGPQPTPTIRPENSASKLFKEEGWQDSIPPLPDEKATVEVATYDPKLSEAIVSIKVKTLEKQGLLNHSVSSGGTGTNQRVVSQDLIESEIEKLFLAGASIEDVYWINYLMQDSPNQTLLELLKWKQEGKLSWEDIQGELENQAIQKKNPSSVQNSTYQDDPIFQQFPSITSLVYGEDLFSPDKLKIAASTVTAFDMRVAGIFDGLVVRAQLNQTNKPQFGDRNTTDEVIDPVSGSLTWKENQIHLPGRDSLDLDIGIMYSSNQGHSFERAYSTSGNYTYTDRYDHYFKMNSLGVGWSFQFPSIEKIGDYRYYHDGKGGVYAAITYPEQNIDEFTNYTHLLNYKQKNMRFVYNNEYHEFNNGEEDSWYYVEFEDKRREYFSFYGALIGIVDRFGNTINFKHRITDIDGIRSVLITSITDTVGREITFEYEDNLNTQEIFNGENVTIRVKQNGTEVQKVILTKGRKLVQVNELQVYLPVLWSVTDQNGDKTYFDYEEGTAFYQTWSDYPGARNQNYHTLLKEVIYPKSKIEYTYERVSRNIGEDQTLHQFRLLSRVDRTGPKKYNWLQYTYTGDYTGFPTYYPPYLQQNNRYSSTVTLKSDTAANNFKITRNFDGKGKLLSTDTQAANGERKVVTNTAFDGLFELFPTKTTISEYGVGDSEAGANHLYAETTYTNWGKVSTQTKPLTSEQINNSNLKQHYTTTISYEPKYQLEESRSWYQNESDPAPSIERYTYTDKGRLSTVTNDALGEQTIYSYDNRDTLGGISQWTAEKTAKGQLVSKTVSIYGSENHYAYPTEQQQWFNIGKSDQKIVKTKMSYDLGTGLLKSQSDGNDQTTTYEYDAAGRLKKETHPIRTNSNGETSREVIDYNYYNQTSSNFDSENAGTYTLKVNTIKTVTQLSNNSKVQTNSAVYYNGLGLALMDELYDDNVGKWVFTHYHYDDQGRPTYQKDTLGNEITASYDAWGRQNRATDANNNLYVTDHNLKQRKTESYMVAADTQERLNYLETIYDPWGQPINMKTYKDWPSQSQPLTESYRYDINGNVIGYTDPANHLNEAGVTTSYSYDALNRLTSVYDALNQRTRYMYDGNGQLAKVTVQAKGGTEQTLNTKYYNEVGLLTSKLDGASQSESLSYNALGQLTSKTDRNGSVFGYNYDEIGGLKSSTVSGNINNVPQTQKTEVIHSDGSPNLQTTKTYLNGTMKAVQSSRVNSLNQVRSMSGTVYPSGVAAHSAYILNQRDALGRMTQLNDSYLGFYVNYQYNKTRLDKVQINGSSVVDSASAANVQYGYTANNLVKFITYPTLTDGSVLQTAYTYNKALNWVESITNQKGSSVLSRYVYGYDNNGNVISVKETKKDGTEQTTTFAYDALNRLIATVHPGGGRDTYTYDVRGNRLTMEQSVSDPVASFEDTSYSYDLWNTLTSVTKNRSETRFEYYADGLRAVKSKGSTHTQVNYDFNGQVITEEKLNGNNIVQKSTYVRGDRVLVKKDKTASKDYYYLYNGHGDVVQMVDTSGAIVNSYAYDVWGNITSQKEETPNPFKYTGEVYDEETGFYYLRARYYDPSMGRFLNEDTYEGQIDNPLSQNLYTYVHNNPLRYTDPSGHFAKDTYDVQELKQLLSEASSISKDSKYFNAYKTKIMERYGFDSIMDENQYNYLYGLLTGTSAYTNSAGRSDWASDQLVNAYYESQEAAYVMMYAAGMAGGLSGRAGGSKKSGCNCFIAGTKVQTDEGEKNIEDIEVGDKVLSKDENNSDGELAYKEVTGLYRNQRDDIIKLYVGEQIIETTNNHPFWVEEKGWVFADELQARDKLQKADGSNLTIDKVEFIKLEENVTVYNFTVADYHTYYVTDIGIWVHNTNCNLTRVWDLEGTGDAITKSQLKKLTEGMKKNGWTGDPVEIFEINGKKLIVDGHHRVRAAKQAGIENIPTRTLTEQEINARGITRKQLLDGYYYGN
ncbi:tRNA(Glu)-specific nuclease WapA precursor [compost metagenome]